MYSISNIFSSEIFFARNSSSDILINSPPMRKSKGNRKKKKLPLYERLWTDSQVATGLSCLQVATGADRDHHCVLVTRVHPAAAGGLNQ
nr:hypothetical protein Iba_chr11fCG0560 [Ipomoea batatas]